MEIGDRIYVNRYVGKIVLKVSNGYIINFKRGFGYTNRFCYDYEVEPFLQVNTIKRK